MEKEIVLGFSGGVDSALSALLLQDRGCRVHAVYLDIGNPESREYAEYAAKEMGLSLEVTDIREELEAEVCKPFEQAYLSGQTPNPCILCNPAVKFRKLLEAADRLGIEYAATGHYARTEGGKLYKGKPANDQSYLLCRLKAEQVRRLLLPLGEYEKAEVRALAAERAVPAAKKPDSQEICFIRDMSYRDWLEARGCRAEEGDFLFREEVIGRHKGIFCYTVGQRLPGLYDGRKLYISKIDAEKNQIRLALWEDTFFTKVSADRPNWLIDPPQEAFRASIRVRHTKWETPGCTVIPRDDGFDVLCEEPVRSPAPGQSAALYMGEQLVGSGIIK